jgi:hypothetical protein
MQVLPGLFGQLSDLIYDGPQSAFAFHHGATVVNQVTDRVEDGSYSLAQILIAMPLGKPGQAFYVPSLNVEGPHPTVWQPAMP